MKINKWTYLILLTFIWGSSFILMKKALVSFDAIHVGALRIIICGIFLVVFFGKSIKKIRKYHWKWVLASAISGSLLPSFLFAYAVKNIGSSIPSILNSLTPLNTLWVSVVFFGFSFNKKQVFGLIIGLIGTIALIYQGASINSQQNYFFASLPLISSITYAFNVNIIKKHLNDLESIAITTGSFILILIPSIIILFFTDFFSTIEFDTTTQISFFYLIVLALVCTALAKILYNKLIHISSTIFSTSIAYLIPIIAVLWGVLDGEKLNLTQVLSGVIILVGVWFVNKKSH